MIINGLEANILIRAQRFSGATAQRPANKDPLQAEPVPPRAGGWGGLIFAARRYNPCHFPLCSFVLTFGPL